MTISRAKGEGNGHVYHFEVTELPFHRIPFVSCFISLIDNIRKTTFYLKITRKIAMIFEVLCWGVYFWLNAYYANSVAQPSAVRMYMTMQDAYQVMIRFNCAHLMAILISTVPRAALCATHIYYTHCIM